VIKTTEAANRNVIRRAISSPLLSLDKNEREPVTGPALSIIGFAIATSHFGFYWIWLIACNSFSTTSLGSFA
jgi:hypothetical protein